MALALAALFTLGAAPPPAPPPPPPVFVPGATPSNAELVYLNARLALREGRPDAAIKLWLLHNALENQTGRVSIYDQDFHSVTWAALGDLGLCQDGHPKDVDGAGLWPLALQNTFVRTMGREPRSARPRPFDSFEVNKQTRFVAIGDILGSAELATVRLDRGRCFGPRLAAIRAGELPNARLSDRQVAARVLLSLLTRAERTLNDAQVRGQAVIAARRFDLLLKLAELAAREARQKARDESTRARQLGLSREVAEAMRAEAPTSTLPPDSEAAQILRACMDWPISEWMALSPDRRLFMFDYAVSFGASPEAAHAVAIGVLDALIEARDGAGATQWIPRASAGVSPAVIWDGPRGAALLSLDAESGFTERAVLSMHRGVAHLERGEIPEALQSFALALKLAPESSASEVLTPLSLRWLNHVSSQYQLGEDLLATLEALVPRRELAVLIEDMMWRAAFRADAGSFQRGEARLAGRGAAQRRLDLLTPLASGDVKRFMAGLRGGLKDSPSETLRFIEQLIERLELEDPEVRAAQAETLKAVRTLLLTWPWDVETAARQARTVEALLARSQAILEGLGPLGEDAPASDRARALSPDAEVYGGAVRLAPADPLPWPFRAQAVTAPSVFTPLKLTPVEWPDGAGALVLGWEIHE
ncbi:hypothetical protein L6R49_29125 [Myxococcota bacterium]|nr:hypothetical protein [Myxococcota bacterium]